METSRIYYLDNLSAILIIYMIFVVHLSSFCMITGIVFDIVNCLFFFFMSWFFFKSGMFFKEKEPKAVLNSTFRRLIVPYIIFNIAGIIVQALEYHLVGGGILSISSFSKAVIVTIFINEAIYPNLALWFLLSLFIVRNVFNYLHRKKLKTSLIFAISIVCLFTIYYMCYFRWADYDNIPYAIAGMHVSKNFLLIFGNIFCGMTMYSLGYMLKDLQFNKYLFLASILIFVVHIFIPVGIDFRVINSSNLALALLFSLAGIILFDGLFKKYVNHKIPVLTYIGQNTMTYYVTHLPFMYIIFNFLFRNTVSNLLELYIYSSIITIFYLLLIDKLFNIRYFKWMIGK